MTILVLLLQNGFEPGWISLPPLMELFLQAAVSLAHAIQQSVEIIFSILIVTLSVYSDLVCN